MYQCAICNGMYYDLRPHLKKHKVTYQEYQSQFNQNPTLNPFSKTPKEEVFANTLYFESVGRQKQTRQRMQVQGYRA
jgi:hypothetical protein